MQFQSTPYRYIPFLSDFYRTLKRAYRLRKYAGDNVVCMVCGRRFREWLGTEKGADTCPYCESSTRQKFTVWVIENIFGSKAGKARVLYFAPDWGVHKFLQSKDFDCRTIDLGAPHVDIRADATDLPIDSQTYDLIISCHVLEHIPNDGDAIAEMHRVLNKMGVAIIQVPVAQDTEETDEDLSITDPSEREKRYGQFDHVRMYGMDIVNRLERAGFEVEIIRPMQSIPSQEIQTLGIWNDVVFYCRKS